MRSRSAATVVLILLGVMRLQPAFAIERSVDMAASSISARFTQIGVPVDAPFRKFSASVDHDPAKPAEARARIEIDTASFDIGDDDYNAEVRKPEWFDSARHPKANFVAAGLKPNGAGSFEASGKLSLKGRTIDLRLPVSLKSEGGLNIYSGSVSISRKAFGIGGSGWDDTVEDAVKISFRLVVPAAR